MNVKRRLSNIDVNNTLSESTRSSGHLCVKQQKVVFPLQSLSALPGNQLLPTGTDVTTAHLQLGPLPLSAIEVPKRTKTRSIL